MQEAGSLACPPQLDGLPHTWETMAAPGPVCRCHHAVGRAWGQGARPCSLLTHSTWHRAWMEQETRALLNEAEGHESPAPDSQFALGPGLRSLCSFFGPGPLERGEAQGTEVQPKPSRMSEQPTSHLRPLAHSPGLSSCRGWHRSRQVWHSGVPGLHKPQLCTPLCLRAFRVPLSSMLNPVTPSLGAGRPFYSQLGTPGLQSMPWSWVAPLQGSWGLQRLGQAQAQATKQAGLSSSITPAQPVHQQGATREVC